MTQPIVPRNPKAGTRDRRVAAAVQVILNSLVRRGDVTRDTSANKWRLRPITAADIPAEIARDAEVTAAIAAILFPMPVSFVFAVGAPAAVGADKTTHVIMPYAGTIVRSAAVAKTGPVGADLVFDVNLNGTTIWATQANRLKIADGQTEGTQNTFDTTAVAAGDTLSIDVDQVGSGTAGQDVGVVLVINFDT